MNNSKRNTFKLLALALGAVSLPAFASGDDDDDDGFRAGKVFTTTSRR